MSIATPPNKRIIIAGRNGAGETTFDLGFLLLLDTGENP